jgi:hypothetical protein
MQLSAGTWLRNCWRIDLFVKDVCLIEAKMCTKLKVGPEAGQLQMKAICRVCAVLAILG